MHIQVVSAQQAVKKVDQELQALESTLKDIESARPFEDLTTADVARARPEITKAVEEMVKNGKWTTPGYGEKVSCFSRRDFVTLQAWREGSAFAPKKQYTDDDLLPPFSPPLSLSIRAIYSSETYKPCKWNRHTFYTSFSNHIVSFSYILQRSSTTTGNDDIAFEEIVAQFWSWACRLSAFCLGGFCPEVIHRR